MNGWVISCHCSEVRRNLGLYGNPALFPIQWFKPEMFHTCIWAVMLLCIIVKMSQLIPDGHSLYLYVKPWLDVIYDMIFSIMCGCVMGFRVQTGINPNEEKWARRLPYICLPEDFSDVSDSSLKAVWRQNHIKTLRCVP